MSRRRKLENGGMIYGTCKDWMWVHLRRHLENPDEDDFAHPFIVNSVTMNLLWFVLYCSPYMGLLKSKQKLEWICKQRLLTPAFSIEINYKTSHNKLLCWRPTYKRPSLLEWLQLKSIMCPNYLNCEYMRYIIIFGDVMKLFMKKWASSVKM